jgi:hypothetical protein
MSKKIQGALIGFVVGWFIIGLSFILVTSDTDVSYNLSKAAFSFVWALATPLIFCAQIFRSILGDFSLLLMGVLNVSLVGFIIGYFLERGVKLKVIVAVTAAIFLLISLFLWHVISMAI